MSPNEFLSQARERWPTLPDDALSECDDEARTLVRSMESHAAQLEFAALSDLVSNCQNKYQFAKTYKVLRADFQRMLANQGSIPNQPEHVSQAVNKAFKLVGQQMLSEMENWFTIRFADANDLRRYVSVGNGRVRLMDSKSLIELYAGKQGAGCALILAVAAGIVLACAAVF